MDPVTLESALEKKCKNYLWLIWIFLLASTPGIFNAMHITSYVFLGGDPSFFCNIPELQVANWTNEQIKKISCPGIEKQSCLVYAWNYTFLAEIGFDEALAYYNTTKKPELTKCTNYIYNEKIPKQTIVSQWDLVCDNLPLRSTAQVVIALGKFFGAFFFGLFSDRFGRKKIFTLSCLLYIAAGPVGAFVDSYLTFIILRLLIGIAGSGVYEAGYTILSELTVKNYRAYLGCLYNVSYSFGFIFLPLAAYYTNNWRDLQLAISLPTIFLLFHCWYLPESPRWLITRGKLEKAFAIIGSSCPLESEGFSHNRQNSSKDLSHSRYQNVIIFLKSYFKLYSTLELSKRILICYFGWFVGNLCYYVIALNGTNFIVNEYLYVGLNGLAEVPGYILPSIVLTYFGRRSTSVALFIVAGLALLVILIIPQGWPVMTMAMVGRLTVSAVFSVIILQTSELFPTENRNTAVGSCLTVAQLGTMAAPYIVDLMGKKAWWIPSTLCGSLALAGGFLSFFLPETRDSPMVDTLIEMKEQNKLSNSNVAAPVS